MENITLAVLKADKNNIAESFKKAISFLEKSEENFLSAFYAAEYKFIKKNEPELFEKVKSFVEKERLQPLGVWWAEDEEEVISDEKLARHVLYSQKFFKKNFGKIFRTGFGVKVLNPLASEIIFRAGYNCYVEENSSSNEAFYWIDAKNGHRIMGANALKVNVKSVDEIKENEKTATLDKFFFDVYNTLEDVDEIITLEDNLLSTETALEEALLCCEKKDAVNVLKNGAESKIKEINCAWKALISDCDCAEEKINAISKELEGVEFDADELFTTTSKTVELVAFKKCCKKSDNIILRIRQTADVSEKIVVKSKLLDTCFWVDIEPYEIRSFIINAEGTAQESNLIENINR